jgi:hypothetical protein
VVALSATGSALTAAALLYRRHETVALPLAGGALVAVLGGWADAELLHRLEGVHAGWLVLATLVVGVCALAATRAERRVAPVAAGVAVLALWHATDVAASLGSTELRVLALAGLAAAYSAGALARPRRPEELPLAGGAVLAIATALWLTADRHLPTPYLITVLLVLCCASLAGSVLRPAVRLAATAVALASGGWLLWLVGGYGPAGTDLLLVAVLGVGCVALARWRGESTEEELLFGVAALTLVALACGVALDRGWPYVAAGVGAAFGLALVGYAVRPARRVVVAGAVLALTLATWVALDGAGVTTVEAYTLPLAALVLAASLWCRHLLGHRSWLVAGPGLVIGLGPSTLLTVATDATAARPLLTAAAAVLVLVVGAQRRLQALVVVGAVSAVVVAVSELGPYTLHLPRSLTLGALGVLVLAVGARYEQRRENARQAVSWLASMS